MTDEELRTAIRQVQERARARAPQGALGLDGVEAPDLMPLVHARDAAQAKVAAIGTVNPRPPGLLNDAVQGVKGVIARLLDWHVREQVEFNRAAMQCVEASIAAMTSMSRSLAALAGHQSADIAAGVDLARRLENLRAACERQIAALQSGLETQQAFAAQAEQLFRQQAADIRAWREQQARVLEQAVRRIEDLAAAAEQRLSQTAALEAAHQRRSESEVASFRELVRAQHEDFQHALERAIADVQQRLWADLAKVREEFERLIHQELRLLRLRESLPPPRPGAASPPPRPGAAQIDWLHFAERFRGPEEQIRAQQRRHAARFAGAIGEIVDIGCGRGEFLEAVRELGLSGVGLDANPECAAICAAKGLRAECADVFAYLESQPDASLAGVHCAHVIEHLQPGQVAGLMRLLGAKLRAGAPVLIETPNPECLAVFATYFYADPTHTRPVPAALLRFYLEEAGFGAFEVERLNPAIELLPALGSLPAELRDALFGGLDYAIFARKL